ncbi:Tyrosine recombinase XerD [invertebrate metagenome]|uniref:Tyrosine recombinase XerD n=1 Tax=invertebrate metagenome TaxID=1711999 RepID=A0A2H9T9Z8_9ZZZZ
MTQKERQVHQFTEYLLLERGLSDNTCYAYAQDIGLWKNWLASFPVKTLDQATSHDIKAFMANRKNQQYSAHSDARMIASLRSFYHYLHREGTIRQNITKDILTPRQPEKLPKSLSEADVEKLLDAPNIRSSIGLRDRCMLELLYACGLRISELTHLRSHHVNVRQGTLRILGKGQQERLVPIGSTGIKWLEQYQKQNRNINNTSTDALLFPGRKGKSLTRQAFWYRIKHYVRQANIQADVSPHSLRHAFATHLLNYGADLRVVQLLLGHKHLSTTQIYTHIANHRLTELHKKHHPRG